MKPFNKSKMFKLTNAYALNKDTVILHFRVSKYLIFTLEYYRAEEFNNFLCNIESAKVFYKHERRSRMEIFLRNLLLKGFENTDETIKFYIDILDCESSVNIKELADKK